MRLNLTVTLADVVGEYRALVEEDLISNARQAYRRAWSLRVLPTLGEVPLSELTPLAIANARAAWSGKASTKTDALAFLSRILELAATGGLLPSNPCRSLPRTRGKAQEADWTARALDDLQVQRMLSLTAFHPFGQRSLAGLVFTGLRLGELVSLRWEDVDSAGALVTVRRTFSPDGHGRLEERRTGSGKTRQVPIIPELLPWLDATREAGPEHVLTGTRGGPFDSGNLACAVRWHAIRDHIAAFPDGSALRFTTSGTRTFRGSLESALRPRPLRRSSGTP